MIPVRTKFTVDQVTLGYAGGVVKLSSAGPCDPRNEKAFKVTPNSTIALTLFTGDALDEFRPGDEFYVDFIKVAQ